MTCKTCKWMDVPLTANGRRVVRKDSCFPCTVPIGDPPPLPSSVTRSFQNVSWPPHRSWVSGESGEGCPLHEPYVKGEKTS